MTRERLGPTLVVGDLEITPVERISIRHRTLGSAHLFEGSKRPAAILVRRGDRAWRIVIQEGEADRAACRPEPAARECVPVSSRRRGAVEILRVNDAETADVAPDGGVLAPGPIEVRFQPCAICVQAGDSTAAQLRSGGTVLASEVLPATDAIWIPGDDVGPLELPPTSSFEVAVVHGALRTSALDADPRDPFVFASAFTHGDSVGFSTGFAAPAADLCIVVNDPETLDPSGACALHEDRHDALFDTGGALGTVAAGVPIQYGFSVSPRGRLSGIADLDLDGDGSFETHVPVSGRLSGEDGQLRQSLRLAARGSPRPSTTKLKVNVREHTDTAAFVRTRVQTAKGRLHGARVVETTSNTEAIGDEPRGWRLDFHLSGDQGEISDAQLTLSNGRTLGLFGRHRFVFEVNRTNVRLRSGGAERGVQIEIDSLALDETGSIVRGQLRYRAFGQSGTIRLR